MFKLRQVLPGRYSARFNLLFVAMVMVASTIVAPTTGEALTATSGQLVAYWECEETSGVRYNSALTTINNLADNNTVGYNASGKNGNSCEFNGTNEYLSLASPTWSWANDSTLTGWMEVDATPSSHSVVASEWGNSFIFYFTNSTGLKIKADPHSYLSGSKSINTWYHFALVQDGGTDMKIYIDGVLVSTYNVAPTDDSSTFYLGVLTGNSYYHDGEIDEVSVWSTNLSASDITDLYNGGTGLFYDDLFPVSTTSTTTATTTSTVDVEELKWVLELYLAIFTFLIFTYIGYRFTRIFI